MAVRLPVADAFPRGQASAPQQLVELPQLRRLLRNSGRYQKLLGGLATHRRQMLWGTAEFGTALRAALLRGLSGGQVGGGRRLADGARRLGAAGKADVALPFRAPGAPPVHATPARAAAELPAEDVSPAEVCGGGSG